MSASGGSVRDRIVGVVSEVFHLPIETVMQGVSPATVEGWDSHAHVVLVVTLEECFGIMFEAEDVPELTSIEAMEEIIQRHGA